MSEDGVLAHVVDSVPVGIALITADLEVLLWNRWLEEHSGRRREDVLHKRLDELWPDLNLASLRRKVRQVLTVRNLAFFDARVHGHLFPFRVADPLGPGLEFMPQSAMIAPLPTGPDGREVVCLTVVDETPALSAEKKLKSVHGELLERSRRDALTGLFNRGYVYERLVVECRRTARHATPLSVIVADLDHFKAINDTHGHPAGDAALIAAAKVFQEGVRDTDLVGRYGGEEFVALLPDTPLDGAMLMAERLRTAIAANTVEWKGERIALTSSFGIADSLSPHEPEQLLDRADAALYVAKMAGRNRCAAAPAVTRDAG